MKKETGSGVGKFLTKLGFHQTTRQEYIRLTSVQAKERKLESWSPFTHPQKRVISKDTLLGTGLGFSVGGLLGGFPGMMVGAVAGTYAGNIAGRRQAGKPRMVRYAPRMASQLKALRREEQQLNKR